MDVQLVINSIMFPEDFKRGAKTHPVTLPNGHQTYIAHQLKFGRIPQVFWYYIQLPENGGWMPFDMRPATGITTEDRRLWDASYNNQLAVAAGILSKEASEGFTSIVLTGKEVDNVAA